MVAMSKVMYKLKFHHPVLTVPLTWHVNLPAVWPAQCDIVMLPLPSPGAWWTHHGLILLEILLHPQLAHQSDDERLSPARSVTLG
jgi:hypothetical protein